MKQQKLSADHVKLEFGGSLLRGRRKDVRPLDSKKPIHLVLKATNTFMLLKNKALVDGLIQKYAAKFGVRILDTGVHADHIHLAVQVPNRLAYRAWIRAVTSVLVQKIRGLKWKFRPYTRVSGWGKAFSRLKNYIWRNRREGNLMADVNKRVEEFFEQHIGPYFKKLDAP